MFLNAKKMMNTPNIIISTVMWEFFSVFGMRALLVLYLTQKLNFSDENAFNIYAAYISLIWVSPLIGGWLVDQYLDFKKGVYLGSFLIILGHITLALPNEMALFVGLSLIICGIGFFKTSSICLLGDYYKTNPKKMTAGMTIYYVGGNIGATLAPIVCAYIEVLYGYALAFSVAGFGMILGLSIFYLFHKQLPSNLIDLNSKKNNFSISQLRLKQILGIVLSFIIVILAISWVIESNNTLYILSLVYLIAAIILFKKIKNIDIKVKKSLLNILFLTLVATFFWILDQQGGSSISLFILRNVQKAGIPTGAFQAINPLVIIIGGFLLAIFIQKKVKNAKKINEKTDFIKIIAGLLLLTFGYVIITWGAQMASFSGKVSFWMPVIALSFIGIAEIFIDPVILSKINREIPRELLGTVTAIYYLFVGALANFLSGKVANLSVIPDSIVQSNNLKLSASIYFSLFSQITLVGILAVGLLIIIFLLNRLKSVSIKTMNFAFLRKL